MGRSMVWKASTSVVAAGVGAVGRIVESPAARLEGACKSWNHSQKRVSAAIPGRFLETRADRWGRTGESWNRSPIEGKDGCLGHFLESHAWPLRFEWRPLPRYVSPFNADPLADGPFDGTAVSCDNEQT